MELFLGVLEFVNLNYKVQIVASYDASAWLIGVRWWWALLFWVVFFVKKQE